MNYLTKHPIRIGLAIIIFGIIFDTLFAGIPNQDPTEEMLASYNRNATISTAIIVMGFCLLLFGIIKKALRKSLPNQY